MPNYLPPVPPGNDLGSPIWRDWFNKLNGILGAVGTGTTVTWTNIDFTGSNITSILSRAISDTTGTLSVTRGGTSLTTLTSHAVYVGNGTLAPTALSVGATNQFLKGSTGADPAFGTATLASADFANQGTTTTILHGNASGNPSWSAVSLTADITGTLAVGNGGTGAATLADGGLLIGNATDAIEVVAAGTTSQILVGGGALTAPVWGTNLPTGVTIGSAYIYRASGTDVPVADGGTGLSTIADGSVLVTNSTDTLTALTATALQGIRRNAGNTAWETFTPSATTGTVTSVAQTFTGGLVSVSGSPVTSSGTLALTVAGTSGGIPYFDSTTSWATSAALAASALVIGGGAGVAPSTITTGTGVLTALGVNTGSAGAVVLFNGAGGTPSSLTLTNASGLPAAGVTGTALVSAAIGTTVQAYDADLTTWAAITPAAGIGTWLATPSGANLAAALTSALPVSKGGTALTTIADAAILVTNAADTLTALTATALQGIRRNAGNTAWEAFTPSTTTGTVTSVGWTGGIVSIATATTTPAFTIAGTSGGIPYFSSTTTWATSAALAANALVIGGGAGVAPSTTTTGANVLTALGIAVGSAGAFVTFNGAGGTPSSMTATNLSGTAANLTAGNVTTNANLTGDVTSVGNATTLTNAPVIAKVLTGYVSGAGTVAATDSILEAIQKLNGNDATNANLTGPITSVGNATSIASQTGTGTKFVVDTSPTLVTPILGVASATSLATSAASPLLLTNGQLVSIALTSQTTGATTLTIPDFAGVVDEFTFKTKSQTMSNKTFVAPALGTPISGTLTNATGLPAAGVVGTALVEAAIGTTVQAYDADLTTWAGVTPGTGVATALAVNVGSAGAFVTFNGALGTPSSGTLTNATGLPIGGISATGTPSATTFLRGDGTWDTPAGAGTVTSVAQSFTGGLISVAGSPITGSGTLALTVAGTSGGIPYFSSGNTWATSAALAASAIVLGGGAGAAPATTTTGTGVVTALGVNVGTAGAFVVNGGALGTPSSGTVTNLTGTASININGTVGATSPTTGAFTTLTESTGAAWTAYTPTLTTDTGTFGALTVTKARYRLLGKTLFAQFVCNATVATGSPTEFRLTYPGGASGATTSVDIACLMANAGGALALGTARQTASTYVSFQNGGVLSGVVTVSGSFVFELA